MRYESISWAGHVSSYSRKQLLAARFILGQDVVNNPYHMPLIHNKLTRNLSDFHGIMKDEMWTAFDDYVGSPTGASTALVLLAFGADLSLL